MALVSVTLEDTLSVSGITFTEDDVERGAVALAHVHEPTDVQRTIVKYVLKSIFPGAEFESDVGAGDDGLQ